MSCERSFVRSVVRSFVRCAALCCCCRCWLLCYWTMQRAVRHVLCAVLFLLAAAACLVLLLAGHCSLLPTLLHSLCTAAAAATCSIDRSSGRACIDACNITAAPSICSAAVTIHYACFARWVLSVNLAILHSESGLAMWCPWLTYSGCSTRLCRALCDWSRPLAFCFHALLSSCRCVLIERYATAVSACLRSLNCTKSTDCTAYSTIQLENACADHRLAALTA